MGLTKKIGCLRANFSTPPLMMLVLKVITPAYHRALDFDCPEIIIKTYHLDCAAE